MAYSPLEKILDKEMDRKEFLLHIGAALVAISGIAAIIKNLSDPFRKISSEKKPAKQKGDKFGQGAYGG